VVIVINANEIRVGDVYRERQVVRVMSSRHEGGMVMVSYETGYNDSFYPDEELLILRKIERITI